ncbi:hypothetical protein LKL35_08580 [Streptomyces sp. ET3-23]|uniref:hypothetical protein n=1 Tax=Streptomyces sp. ET3-23 TaxID=2885643 RepID=UPI001D11941E|nr:hypothetical protein [Streptomyces sp. ET3-23]MCC2275477.1 hypothetical protein [Streptomyces sp. ET3-23]
MSEQLSDGRGLFLPVSAPVGDLAGKGLVQSDLSWAAALLGLTAVPAAHTWMDLTRVYLIAREYLEPAERARGRAWDRDAWITAVLDMYPREEYMCALAALNHASTDDALMLVYQDRFLARLAPDAERLARRALAGGVDGQNRWFLARQLVLRAMRLVLVPPSPQSPSANDGPIGQAIRNLDL